ncbi:MAG TPA: AtpZ/AtpI family protein [Bryobacteraceae bacterium]|nr:AtpZ/AtpI family protein [Bryobacteraceae bacterium]
MASKPNKSVLWFGKYLSLALTLPASVMGGYLLGAAGDHVFHLPFLPAVGILLGMAAGVFQIFRELARDDRKLRPPPK